MLYKSGLDPVNVYVCACMCVCTCTYDIIGTLRKI